jgi:hypothetical protein
MSSSRPQDGCAITTRRSDYHAVMNGSRNVHGARPMLREASSSWTAVVDEGDPLPSQPLRSDPGWRRGATWEPGVTSHASVSCIHDPSELGTWVRAAGLEIHGRRNVDLFRLRTRRSRPALALLIARERLQEVALALVTAGPSLFPSAVRLPVSPPVILDRVHSGEA